MKAFFQNIDLFGVHLQNRVEKNSDMFRSVIGGIISFIIFSASLGYVIWIGYLWSTNSFSAKISQSLYVSDFQLLDINYEVLRINFWNYSNGKYDPFKEHILIPLVTYTYNYTNSETQILQVSNETAFSGTNYIMPKMKLGFTNVKGIIYTTSEMFIKIVKCSPELLSEGQECASQEKMDEFFLQPLNTIIMEIQYKQLNSKDGSIQSSVQELLIQLDDQTCSTLNIYLQATRYEVKNSLFYGKSSFYEFVNGALLQPQTNSLKYCQVSYGYETYALFYIVMNGSQIKTIFEYPSAGDLLANIGSITSVLFMIKHIIFLINREFLNHKLIHQIISFYYPQFLKIKFKKNWKFQIAKVTLNNQPLDTQSFLDFYQKVYQQALEQLTLSNTLYEISRLQIILRQWVGEVDLRNSHSYSLSLDGFLLINKILDGTKQIEASQTSKSETLKYCEQDINLLTLEQRNQYKNNTMRVKQSFDTIQFQVFSK